MSEEPLSPEPTDIIIEMCQRLGDGFHPNLSNEDRISLDAWWANPNGLELSNQVYIEGGEVLAVYQRHRCSFEPAMRYVLSRWRDGFNDPEDCPCPKSCERPEIKAAREEREVRQEREEKRFSKTRNFAGPALNEVGLLCAAVLWWIGMFCAVLLFPVVIFLAWRTLLVAFGKVNSLFHTDVESAPFFSTHTVGPIGEASYGTLREWAHFSVDWLNLVIGWLNDLTGWFNELHGFWQGYTMVGLWYYPLLLFFLHKELNE